MRKCGDCQACCKLLPVAEIAKPFGQRCKNQKVGTGCRIHGTLAFPLTCATWSCAWLRGATDLKRPDHGGYVVDSAIDYITTDDDKRVMAVQVWVDPRNRDAHNDPGLRAYLADRGGLGFVAIIRYSPTDGFVLIPPDLGGGKWIALESRAQAGRAHSPQEVAEAYAATHAPVVPAPEQEPTP